MSTRKVEHMPRESRVSDTFLLIADTLVADFDIIDLLTVLADRCVELLDADASGILLADSDGNLRVMAASSEQAHLLELFQLQNEEGPCLEAFSTGKAVSCTELRTAATRWPKFTSFAVDTGFECVYALPLRLRDTIIGALNLFRAAPGPMPDADVRLAQALADIASVAMLQDQAARQTLIVTGQLRNALDSRIVIEQAKGVLCERLSVDMAAAFEHIRNYARGHNMQLTNVAAAVVAGTIVIENSAAAPPMPRRPTDG